MTMGRPPADAKTTRPGGDGAGRGRRRPPKHAPPPAALLHAASDALLRDLRRDDRELVGSSARDAKRALAAALRDAAERDGPSLMILKGPPGSGKTAVCRRALRDASSHVTSVDPSCSASAAVSEVRMRMSFAADVADSMAERRPVPGQEASPPDEQEAPGRLRSVLLDDAVQDCKALSRLYDELTARRPSPRVAIVVCFPRSARVQSVARRACFCHSITYPSRDETIAWAEEVLRSSSIEAEERLLAAVAAASDASQACPHRTALALLLRNTREGFRDMDMTIVQVIKESIAAARSGAGYDEVRDAISNEPTISAMTALECAHRRHANHRRRRRDKDERDKDVAPPETSFRDVISRHVALEDEFASVASAPGPQAELMTQLFVRAATHRPDERFDRGDACFPKCYTVISSRSGAVSRMSRAAAGLPTNTGRGNESGRKATKPTQDQESKHKPKSTKCPKQRS